MPDLLGNKFASFAWEQSCQYHLVTIVPVSHSNNLASQTWDQLCHSQLEKILPVTFGNNSASVPWLQSRWWWWWWWWWWWIVFVVRLTEERHLALFPAWTIIRDPHYRKSLTSDPRRARFEPVQNQSSGLIEWSYAVVINTTPQRASLT